MNEKFIDATAKRPEGQRTVDSTMVTIDLSLFIEQIRNEQAWKENDRNSITIFKSIVTRIVLIALHKGAEMAKHKANGLISVQVLEGQMRLTTSEQTIDLCRGQMLVLHEGIEHSVYATQETVFLLTLTTAMVGK